MLHSFLNFFLFFPPVLATLLMAIFPVAERIALPTAIAVFHLSAWEAFGLVVLGNTVPIILILALAEKFHNWVGKEAGFFGRAWVKSVEHAQAKFARYEKYGLIGLFIFLIIPTPLNGAFSASLIAFILGYPMRKSFPVLFTGVVVANLILLAATVGAVRIF